MPNRRSFLRGAGLLAVAAAGATMTSGSSAPQSVLWDSHAPVLNQGEIGSCTGNAVTQLLNTDYAMRISGRTSYLDESDAIEVYELATDLDSFPGSYPTDDTGSFGSSACEAAVQLGYLSGYQCVASDLQSLISALRTQPLIVGTNWMSSMLTPDSSGLVDVSGYVAGGHEFVILGFDMGDSCFTCLNSWSDAWGVKGRFKVRFDDFVRLLAGHVSAANAPTVKAA